MAQHLAHNVPSGALAEAPAASVIASDYTRVRAQTAVLAAGLSDADATIQSMPDASPAKWHLAHTTWFFEAMVLCEHSPGYQPFDPRFGYLFNSYYEALGPRHQRHRRGMLSRPSLAQVMDYRAHVDHAVGALLEQRCEGTLATLIELGLNHEQQHQELLLTDILHAFASNPIEPALWPVSGPEDVAGVEADARFRRFAGGLLEFGHDGAGFAFDCEGPRHRRWLDPFFIAERPVSNGEWCGFIEDGGYRRPELWLSDGWATCQTEGWEAPLYWQNDGGEWSQMSLRGRLAVIPDAPVCHVSYFEADAFARWAGHRLPTEFEWECAAVQGGLGASSGQVWEWTASAFAPYPGFRPDEGAIGEYNGKFMSGQQVLRGGSLATPQGHLRPTYRNFFPPTARWQFAGLRLAKDIS